VAEVTVRIVQIAELLGVSKQRARQLAGDGGFLARSPKTLEDGRGKGTR